VLYVLSVVPQFLFICHPVSSLLNESQIEKKERRLQCCHHHELWCYRPRKILFINRVKIPLPIEESYRPPYQAKYWAHSSISFYYVFLVSILRSTSNHIALKYRCPHYCCVGIRCVYLNALINVFIEGNFAITPGYIFCLSSENFDSRQTLMNVADIYQCFIYTRLLDGNTPYACYICFNLGGFT
jgi:hypothetical protein